MIFIKDYLTKISSNRGWFYNKKNIELVYNLIDSKMAILNGNGEIIATEGFEQGADGNYYSNDSYKATYWGLYDYNFYDSWFNDYVESDCKQLECPLMQLKKNEILYYEDGRVEEYEQGYHNLYLTYLTKDGDIYSDYEDCSVNNRVPMKNLVYMGKGRILNKLSPISKVEFRKDVVGFI